MKKKTELSFYNRKNKKWVNLHESTVLCIFAMKKHKSKT